MIVALRADGPGCSIMVGLDASGRQFFEGAVEIRDRDGGQRVAGARRVDHHVEPGRLGDLPHHLVLVDEHVRRRPEEALEEVLATRQVRDRNASEGDLDLHGSNATANPNRRSSSVPQSGGRARRERGEQTGGRSIRHGRTCSDHAFELGDPPAAYGLVASGAAALAAVVASVAAVAVSTGVSGADAVPVSLQLGRRRGVDGAHHRADAGDQNPYGVANVPFSTGNLVRGDTLVSNFNASNNTQGTGTTIVEVAPSGQVSLFAQIDPTPAGSCPGGVGLTTALSVLNDGYVVVGSLPVTKQRKRHAPRPDASSCSTATACRSRRGPGTASTGPGT